MFGVFWKIKEICNKMASRIFKIDGEMSEIVEPKVDNPKIHSPQIKANLFHPCAHKEYQVPIFESQRSTKTSQENS